MTVARRDVKLAVLGDVPKFFDVEQVPTVADLLRVAEVPRDHDVRVNGLLLSTANYDSMALQAGDMVICVPNIEGGR